MSDLPTLYLIDTPLNDQISMIVELQWAGVLVPVERCEHGNIDEHDYLANKVDEHGRKFVAAEWCNGSPTLEVTGNE